MTGKTSPSPLESHLGYWLRFVSNHVSHAFSQKVQARGVSVAEWVVLRELHDGALMPSVIAERLGMTRGGVSKLVDKLAAKGLALRSADGSDGRAQRVTLTAAGLALVPELAALADANDEEFFGGLAPATRQTIEAAMRDIVGRLRLGGVPVD